MRRGFTLIECMICIAILSISAAVITVSWLGLGDLRRENDFRFASRSARRQLAWLEKAPFDRLPPEFCQVDSSGWLQLGQPDVDPGSLQLTSCDGHLTEVKTLAVDARKGRCQLESAWKGKKLLADYAFSLADRDEAQLVPPDGRVPLWNRPARSLESVYAVKGDEVRALSGARLSPDGLFLELAPGARPAVVSVDYRGGLLTNQVRGRFLSEALEAVDSPSPVKLMELQENYSGGGAFRLTTLRVGP